MSTTSRDLARAVEALRSTASVVTRQRLIDYPNGPHIRVVEFSKPASLRSFGALRGAQLGAAVALKMTPDIGSIAATRVEMRSYMYALLDRNEREVLAWHWQPDPQFAGPDHPHLHVSAAIRFPDALGRAWAIDLDKLHLPTGPVSFAAVVRMLIEEFGVQPLAADRRERLDVASA